VTANLYDSPTGGEHPGPHNAPVPGASPPERTSPGPPSGPPGPTTNGIWLAIYALTAIVSSVVAILIATAVHAGGMQIATAGGATFLAVLGMAITVHRFLKDR
jgi:hypothetical protein